MSTYQPFPVNGLRVNPGTLGARARAELRSVARFVADHSYEAAVNVAVADSLTKRGPFTLEQYEARRSPDWVSVAE